MYNSEKTTKLYTCGNEELPENLINCFFTVSSVKMLYVLNLTL